jgi:hypothetical protein
VIAVAAGTVNINKLSENPGLYPHKIGNALNIQDCWTFIHTYNISEINIEFRLLKEKFVELQKNSINTTHGEMYKGEFYNYEYLTAFTITRVEEKFKQILPKYKNKRGIIDGLGSIIKLVTGNLDANDAIKYDKAIKRLTVKQSKDRKDFVDNMSMAWKTMDKLSNTTKTLKMNQQLMKSRILQLESAMNELHLEDVNPYIYTMSSIVYTQLNIALNSIYQILMDIEDAMTFAQLNTLHPAIIKHDEILNELKSIEHFLPSELRFPVSIDITHVQVIEEIVNIKSYISGETVVFLLDVPLIDRQDYALYHLFPIPTFQNNSFYTMLPKSKYLLINDQNYAQLNAPCKEITTENYLCDIDNLNNVNKNSSCEVQLINFSNNYEQCKLTKLKLEDVKVKKISKSQWIVTFPSKTVLKTNCENHIDKNELIGNYIIHIDNNCEVQIKNITLKTLINQQTQNRIINLPKLNLNNIKQPKDSKVASWDITHMDMEDLVNHPILQFNEEEDDYETEAEENLNFNLIICLICFIIVLYSVTIVYKIYSKDILKYCNKRSSEQPIELEAINVAQSDNQRRPIF